MDLQTKTVVEPSACDWTVTILNDEEGAETVSVTLDKDQAESAAPLVGGDPSHLEKDYGGLAWPDDDRVSAVASELLGRPVTILFRYKDPEYGETIGSPWRPIIVSINGAERVAQVYPGPIWATDTGPESVVRGQKSEILGVKRLQLISNGR